MKSIYDMSKPEIAELNENQLSILTQIEIMKAGLVLPDPPVNPELFELKPTVPVWEIRCGRDFICRLPSSDLADAVLAASNHQFVREDYIYGVGYERKFPDSYNHLEIVKNYLYDEGELRRKADEVKKSSERKEIYVNAKRDYDAAFDKVQKVSAAVRGCYYEACREKRQADKVIETFESYKSLTNNNEDIALKFLKQAFSEDEIEIANEFRPAILTR